MFVINFAVSSMLHTNENKKTIADCARGGAGEAGPHPLVRALRSTIRPQKTCEKNLLLFIFTLLMFLIQM